MSSKIWFILSEGEVTGPYDHEEIDKKSSEMKDIQIWGRGQGEWVAPAKWRQSLKEIPPPTKAEISSKQQLWKLRYGGNERPPMNYEELLTALRGIPDLSTVYVAAEPQGVWKEVYAVERLIDDLGVSRRSHPRVPIVGTLVCESEAGEFSCRVISVSEGGVGINDAKNLHIGDKFNGTLTSPNLYVSITTTCEVVYVGSDGYAGIRFSSLPAEAKSSLVEYVNKFTTH